MRIEHDSLSLNNLQPYDSLESEIGRALWARLADMQQGYALCYLDYDLDTSLVIFERLLRSGHRAHWGMSPTTNIFPAVVLPKGEKTAFELVNPEIPRDNIAEIDFPNDVIFNGLLLQFAAEFEPERFRSNREIRGVVVWFREAWMGLPANNREQIVRTSCECWFVEGGGFIDDLDQEEAESRLLDSPTINFVGPPIRLDSSLIEPRATISLVTIKGQGAEPPELTENYLSMLHAANDPCDLELEEQNVFVYRIQGDPRVFRVTALDESWVLTSQSGIWYSLPQNSELLVAWEEGGPSRLWFSSTSDDLVLEFATKVKCYLAPKRFPPPSNTVLSWRELALAVASDATDEDVFQTSLKLASNAEASKKLTNRWVALFDSSTLMAVVKWIYVQLLTQAIHQPDTMEENERTSEWLAGLVNVIQLADVIVNLIDGQAKENLQSHTTRIISEICKDSAISSRLRPMVKHLLIAGQVRL